MFTCTVVVENGMYLSAPLNSKSKESFGAGDEKSAPNDVKCVVKELVFDIRECLEKFKGIWIKSFSEACGDEQKLGELSNHDKILEYLDFIIQNRSPNVNLENLIQSMPQIDPQNREKSNGYHMIYITSDIDSQSITRRNEILSTIAKSVQLIVIELKLNLRTFPPIDYEEHFPYISISGSSDMTQFKSNILKLLPQPCTIELKYLKYSHKFTTNPPIYKKSKNNNSNTISIVIKDTITPKELINYPTQKIYTLDSLMKDSDEDFIKHNPNQQFCPVISMLFNFKEQKHSTLLCAHAEFPEKLFCLNWSVENVLMLKEVANKIPTRLDRSEIDVELIHQMPQWIYSNSIKIEMSKLARSFKNSCDKSNVMIKEGENMRKRMHLYCLPEFTRDIIEFLNLEPKTIKSRDCYMSALALIEQTMNKKIDTQQNG